MDASDQPRVALLGYGYWGPNLARNLHLRLGRGWVACVDPDRPGGPRSPTATRGSGRVRRGAGAGRPPGTTSYIAVI